MQKKIIKHNQNQQQHIIKKQKSDFSLATLNNLRKKSKYWSEKPGKGSGNEQLFKEKHSGRNGRVL